MLSLLVKYLIGFLGIGVVVVIHELGHLAIAHICGITVEVFSFGMGPKLWGWQQGRTEIRLSLLPFGGYCRMKGSDDLNRALETKSKTFKQAEAGSLFAVHPVKRLLTYLAGPLSNMLFAALIYAIIQSAPTTVISTKATISTVNNHPAIFGQSSSNADTYGLREGDLILAFDDIPIEDYQSLEKMLAQAAEGFHQFLIQRDGQRLTIEAQANNEGRWGIANSIEPIIGQVRTSSPEEKAGLREGDRILSCNGNPIGNNYDLLDSLLHTKEATMTILRNGKTLEISFIAKSKEDGTGSWLFSLKTNHKVQKGTPFSLIKGMATAWDMFQKTMSSLIALLTGKTTDVRQEFTGTGRAALMIGDITSLGFENHFLSGLRALVYLMGIVSVSLTVGNLLPLPAFDGGQILIALAEIIIHRTISPKSYWILQLAGMCSVIVIFMLMSYVDLRHLYLVKRP